MALKQNLFSHVWLRKEGYRRRRGRRGGEGKGVGGEEKRNRRNRRMGSRKTGQGGVSGGGDIVILNWFA
jgi:hypothetical protein